MIIYKHKALRIWLDWFGLREDQCPCVHSVGQLSLVRSVADVRCCAVRVLMRDIGAVAMTVLTALLLLLLLPVTTTVTSVYSQRST